MKYTNIYYIISILNRKAYLIQGVKRKKSLSIITNIFSITKTKCYMIFSKILLIKNLIQILPSQHWTNMRLIWNFRTPELESLNRSLDISNH